VTARVQPHGESTPSGAQPRFVAGLPLLGVLPDLIRDPAEHCRRLMIEHEGRLLRLRVGPGSLYLLTDPEHVEHVLSRNAENYWKGTIFNRIRFVLGGSLLLTEGEEWRRQRRLLQPAFGPKRLRALFPWVRDMIGAHLSPWGEAARASRELDLTREMRRITMRVGAAAMFSRDLSDELSDAIAAAFDTFLKHVPVRLFTFYLPEWLPVPGQRATLRAVRELDRLVYALIEERRSSGADPADVLSLILSPQPPLSKQEIRDHVVTILFGGYEATAVALTWIWCLVAAHPDVAARLRAEVDAVLGSREPAYEDLARLEYAEQVIRESLRLYPPFWESFRTAYKDDEIAGVRIPGGASLLLCPYATHRAPRLWSDPERFDPDRFASDQPRRHRYAYFPFLEGQRACIGESLAMMEMKLVLALAIREFSVRLPDGYALAARSHGTLRPRRDPWVRVERR
jgi:enediyne biosynthesis protein E7